MYAVIVRVVVKWTSLLFSIVFGWSAQYVHIVQRKRIERSHFSCFYLFSIYLILDLSRLFFLCWLQQYCNVHGTQFVHMEKDRRPCEGVSERERDSEKSQSYGVASAPRLTYQQWKTAVHDLTISIFLPSESRCFVQYYITIVDIGRSLFIIFTILVSTIKTISEGKRNTKERVKWRKKKKQDDWNHRRETLFLCGAPSSDSLTNRSEYVDYLKRKEPDTNLLQR